MELKTLQDNIASWEKKNFPDAPSYLSLIKIMEELGELAAHYIGRIEERVGKPPEDHKAGMDDAVADIVISLSVFCVREGIDLDSMVQNVWAEVSKRVFILRGLK